MLWWGMRKGLPGAQSADQTTDDLLIYFLVFTSMNDSSTYLHNSHLQCCYSDTQMHASTAGLPSCMCMAGC